MVYTCTTKMKTDEGDFGDTERAYILFE